MKPGRIELKLRDVQQLFNSLDPSPFHEKDLDADAEEFIVSWAREHGRHQPLSIVVHLAIPPASGEVRAGVPDALHNYFAYRAQMTRRELGLMLRRGRLALWIALGFLTTCMFCSEQLRALDGGPFLNVVGEGLLIGGWVAMWRPLETFLYDWWPLWSSVQVYRRLSRAEVEIVQRPAAGGPT